MRPDRTYILIYKLIHMHSSSILSFMDPEKKHKEIQIVNKEKSVKTKP